MLPIVLKLRAEPPLYNKLISFKRFGVAYFKDKEAVAISDSFVPGDPEDNFKRNILNEREEFEQFHDNELTQRT